MNFRKTVLPPGLIFVGVPIGAARDITLRALDVLASANVLVAEDTRSLRKLMEIHAIPLERRRILSLHDHSSPGIVAQLVDKVREGASVTYASEAGMPLIADPGFELARAMRDADLPVTAAPGPSAVLTALAIGGLPTDAFHFVGFLPQTKGARQKALGALSGIQATLIFYESPKRLGAMLADAADALGADRQAAVCRELTKKFEETRRGSLSDLAAAYEKPPKGEIVVLIDRARSQIVQQSDVEEALSQALQTMRTRDAAQHVAERFGLARRDVYQTALRLSKDGTD
ncbi:MAG: 16S rRNA (cytidine(1402)-2'-O)-methyltransferase [Paracoccaceae bacterium]